MEIRFTALVIAVAIGALFVRHVREMLFNGVGVADGGGYAALLLAEFFACGTALAVALDVHGSRALAAARGALTSTNCGWRDVDCAERPDGVKIRPWRQNAPRGAILSRHPGHGNEVQRTKSVADASTSADRAARSRDKGTDARARRPVTRPLASNAPGPTNLAPTAARAGSRPHWTSITNARSPNRAACSPTTRPGSPERRRAICGPQSSRAPDKR